MWCCNRKSVWLLIIMLLGAPVMAQETTASKTKVASTESKKPIEITARDSFSWDQANQRYIAQGEVHVVQGEDELFADHVTADYEKSAPATNAGKPSTTQNVPTSPTEQANNRNANGPSNDQQITLIVASGNVHILHNGDDITAEKAVYDKINNKVTLTGNNVVLRSPNKVLTGAKKVIYDMQTQQAVAVTAPGQGRLKALLQ